MFSKLLAAASAAATIYANPTTLDLEGSDAQIVLDVDGSSPVVVNKAFLDGLSTDAERDAAIAAYADSKAEVDSKIDAYAATRVIKGHTTKLPPYGPCPEGQASCAYGDATWERLFQINHRQPVEVTINTQGGWFGPTSLRFEMMVDYSGNLRVQHISSLNGRYVLGVRTTTDNLGSGPSMVEVLVPHRYGQQHPVTITATSGDLSTAVQIINAGENLPAKQINGADFYSPSATGYVFGDPPSVANAVDATLSDARLNALIDARIKSALASTKGIQIGHEGRSHLNWARISGANCNPGESCSSADGKRYHHILTNLWGGAGKTDPHGVHNGEDMYIMGYIKFRGYRYAVPGVGESYMGFHNWAQNFHNYNVHHDTSWQVAAKPYMSSTGYVVFVVDCGSGYSGRYCGVTIDLHQQFGYTYRDIQIVDRTWNNEASGVF